MFGLIGHVLVRSTLVRAAFLLLLLGTPGCEMAPLPNALGAPTATAVAKFSENAPRILLFSKTTGFRHGSIPDAILAVETLGTENGFDVDSTEDASVFSGESLATYDAVVFVMTTGDILDEQQQDAFEAYIRGGGGYVGIHSASDTEFDWPWYGDLVGAYFDNHPQIQMATIDVEDGNHGSTEHLGTIWERNDEWYNFRTNPRSKVNVLLALDESTYSGGTMNDHPIAWYHEFDGGRSWYTGGGHTSESYTEADFVQHLLGGILYAAGIDDEGGTVEMPPNPDSLLPTIYLPLLI